MADDKAQVRQDKKDEFLASENELRASYGKIKDEPAFKHIISQGQLLAARHHLIACNGNGFVDGDHAKPIFHDKDQRLSALDKYAGIHELLNYMQNRVSPEKLNILTSKQTKSN